jgi:dTDP-4-dehydrorhamnose reductase
MKYLVTGGQGKLGSELCPLIDCVAPHHTEMDILMPDQVESFIARPDIDAVIHLAAIVSRATAEKDKLLSYRVNVHGTRNIAQAAARHHKKVFYISTEIVFPGLDGNYKETDNPNPKDWYGFTKYAGELEVASASDNHLIIRTTFRPKTWEFPTAFDNVSTIADYVDVIAKEIALCVTINPSGILHLGTPIKTFFELAKRRRPDIMPEAFPDPTFLHRDLNIDLWTLLKNTYQQS